MALPGRATGHGGICTGALEVLDDCIGKVVEVTLSYEGAVIITADHGNAENMFNLQTGVIDKEHSNHAVPCILIGKAWEHKNVVGGVSGTDLSQAQSSGVLADVGPTVLKVLGLKKPPEMNGTALF
jgi:2,3-bisphosphoglycerate-independent phosphoglycerate mutase